MITKRLQEPANRWSQLTVNQLTMPGMETYTGIVLAVFYQWNLSPSEIARIWLSQASKNNPPS
jgi:hypothetical protein